MIESSIDGVNSSTGGSPVAASRVPSEVWVKENNVRFSAPSASQRSANPAPGCTATDGAGCGSGIQAMPRPSSRPDGPSAVGHTPNASTAAAATQSRPVSRRAIAFVSTPTRSSPISAG